MFCTSCGNENSDEAAFCKNCGAAFGDRAKTPPQIESKTAPKASTPINAEVPASPRVESKVNKADAKAAKARAKLLRPFYKKKRFWAFVIPVVAITVAVASANQSGSNPANAKVSLTSYFTQANKDLGSCVAGIGAVQIELASTLKSPTSSNYVNLYSTAKQAEGPCDIAQNSDLLNLGSMNPPSGYATLATFSLDLQTWADSDSVKVLKDVEDLANNPQSTAATSDLITDSQTADSNAHQLASQAATAASQAGTKNIGGNMLLYWGLTTG